MANVKGKCSGCCILNRDCTGCVRCLPRWLCVSVEISSPGTTGTGTGTGTGTSGGLSCCRYAFRMPGNCETWSGSGSCGDASTAMSLDVSLVRPDGTATSECSTRVDVSLLDDPLYFEGALPDMNFTVVTDAGVSLDVTITRANVVENPIANEPCSPCSCATCLPEKFCVSVIGPPSPVCQCTDKKEFTWDCETRTWIGSSLTCGNKEFAVQLSLLPAASGVCGMAVSIEESSGTGSGTSGPTYEEIPFEGALNSRWMQGAPCVGDGVSNNVGVPRVKPCPPETPDCGSPTPQSFSTMITHSITIGLYTFTVTEQVCGSCLQSNDMSDCRGGCRAFQEGNPICGTTPWHVELISPCSNLDGRTWMVYSDGHLVCYPNPVAGNDCQIRARQLIVDFWNCGSIACPDGQIILECCYIWYKGKPGCGDETPDMSRYHIYLAMGGASCSGPGDCTRLFGGISGEFSADPATSDCDLGRIDFLIPTAFFINPAEPCQCCYDVREEFTILRVTV